MENSFGDITQHDTFIFVHEENIVLDFLDKKRFPDFQNLKYVFLGNRAYNKIENNDNVIIARKFIPNYEDYPKLTSFTGWFILWKNNLIKSDYVNLFEYDINLVNNFKENLQKLNDKEIDFIGYFPMSIEDPVFLQIRKYVSPLLVSIKKNKNLDVDLFFQNIKHKHKNLYWSSSSNSTWKKSEWEKYMNWFIDFIDDIKQDDYAGHIHERSISIFHYLFQTKVILTKNLMTHYQLNSHKTSPLPEGRFEQLYNQLV